MTIAEAYFHKITSEMPDVKPGKMFGALCIKTPNGKAAAMFWKENLIVKLEGDVLGDAMSLDGVSVFEPMEGRPMNGWIRIPFDYKTKWKKFTVASVAHVKELKANPSKKK